MLIGDNPLSRLVNFNIDVNFDVASLSPALYIFSSSALKSLGKPRIFNTFFIFLIQDLFVKKRLVLILRIKKAIDRRALKAKIKVNRIALIVKFF